MTLEEVIVQLRHPGAEIPRAAIAEVLARPEEFVPLLIEEIERVTRSPADFDPNDFLVWFALYLLAQLRESRALEPILNFFALNESTEEEIFGDVITVDGSAILAGVAGEDAAKLRQYILRPDISLWVLAAALDALISQVVWREQSPEPLIAFLNELFETDAFEDDVDVWNTLAAACLDFRPGAFLDSVRGLYERGLADSTVLGTLEDVEAEAAASPDGDPRSHLERFSPITDTVEAVSWWQQFAPPDSDPGYGGLSPEEFSYMAKDEFPGTTVRHEQPKIGRNDLCPCGSGKKYKKCCMASGL